MKHGTLAFTFAATGGWSFDFTPDDDFDNEYNLDRLATEERRENSGDYLWVKQRLKNKAKSEA